MHFFNPAPLLPLVEVVSGLATDDATSPRRSTTTAAAWGKVAGACDVDAGLHRQPLRAAVLRRGAAPAGRARRRRRDARCRDARGRRLPHGTVRADGPDRPRRQLRGDAERVGGVLPRSALRAVGPAAGAASPPAIFGRKSGRGFYDYAEGAAQAACPRPSRAQPHRRAIAVRGDAGVAAPLVARLARAGVAVDVAGAPTVSGRRARRRRRGARADRRPHGDRARGGDGRTRRRACSISRSTTRRARACALARADACSDAAFAAAVGALQAAGIAVSRVDDVAGLVVHAHRRDARQRGRRRRDAGHRDGAATSTSRCSKGVNYPRGPLAWADAIGVARVRACCVNLAAHYGEDRYRLVAADRAPRTRWRAPSARQHADRAMNDRRRRASARRARRRDAHVRARSRVAGARHAHRERRRRARAS